MLFPGEDVHDEVVPVLEVGVDDGGAGVGVVVFVEGVGFFVVLGEELDGFVGEVGGFGGEAVFEEGAEGEVVGDSPDGAVPVGGVAAGVEGVHFFLFGEGADAEGGEEGVGVFVAFVDDAFGLVGGGDFGPHGHDAGPGFDALDEAVVVAGVAFVEGEVGAEVVAGFICDGAEVEVDGVEVAVAFVPAVFLDGGFEVGGLLFVLRGGFVGEVEGFGEITHGEELAVHEAVEEDAGGGVVGAEEGGGVVVDADGEIVFPEVEAGGWVELFGAVFLFEGLECGEFFAEPFGVVVVELDEERGVLGEDGFVHVLGGVGLGGWGGGWLF